MSAFLPPLPGTGLSTVRAPRAAVGGPPYVGGRQGTLWDIFLAEGGHTSSAFGPVFLSDANVAALTQAVRAKAVSRLRELAPPLESLAPGRNDAFSNILMLLALELQWQVPSVAALTAANAQCVEAVLQRLSAEQSDFWRAREFAERGVNPAMAPRPDEDTERADHREAGAPPLGHGAYEWNPWEQYAEERGLIDHFRPFNGLTPQDVTGSDDLRIQVAPFAPPR